MKPGMWPSPHSMPPDTVMVQARGLVSGGTMFLCLGDGGDPTGSNDDHTGVLVSDQGGSSAWGTGATPLSLMIMPASW